MSPARRTPYFQTTEVAALATKYKLEEQSGRPSLFERLDLAAEFYFKHKNGIDTIQTTKSIRKELEDIDKLTKRLKLKLTAHKEPDDKNDGAQHALNLAAREAIHSAILDTMASGDDENRAIGETRNASGLKLDRIEIGDGSIIHITFGMNEILNAVEHLEAYTRMARESLPRREAGRHTSYALNNWVSNMGLVWREFRGEEFRVTRPEGVVKSPSALFCIEALAMIDTKVAETTVVSALRRYAHSLQE